MMTFKEGNKVLQFSMLHYKYRDITKPFKAKLIFSTWKCSYIHKNNHIYYTFLLRFWKRKFAYYTLLVTRNAFGVCEVFFELRKLYITSCTTYWLLKFLFMLVTSYFELYSSLKIYYFYCRTRFLIYEYPHHFDPLIRVLDRQGQKMSCFLVIEILKLRTCYF